MTCVYRRIMFLCHVLVILLAAGVLHAQAQATTPAEHEEPVGLIAAFNKMVADSVGPEAAQPQREPFTRGSWAVDVFGIATSNINNEPGANLYGGGLGLSYYVEDNLAIRAEAIGLGLDQNGDDAAAGGLTLLARWHFYRQPRWSLFVEGGAGFLISDVSIPDGSRSRDEDGTNFNFTPQAGVGATYQLADNMHLVGGFRYIHISNASIEGGSRNPGNDTIGGYLGVMFTF